MAAYVKAGLQPFAEERGYLFRSRTKTLSSLSEKLESGRYPAWSEIDDLFGCSIVVPSPVHEAAVLEHLDSSFECVDLRKRNGTKKAPDVFRFDWTRFIGKVREEVADEMVPGARSVLFEIQIPTVFENAWSVVTHDVVYKSDDVDWRKHRMVGILKAAVEQIELLIAGFEQSVEFVPRSDHPETQAKEHILEVISGLLDDGTVSQMIRPESLSRLAENVYGLVSSSAKNWKDAPRLAIEVVDAVEESLRSTAKAKDLVAGSLFQVVLGEIGGGVHAEANLDRFVVVDSEELHSLHGLGDIPKPFSFDV